MNNPKVFLVTPVFNAEAHIEKFLKSIQSQTYDNVTPIIINDGSTDNTANLIGKAYPDTIVLDGDGSLWWSGCTNRGVEYATEHGADYIVTVNVDVELDKKCIESLVSLAQKETDTLVGSVVRDIQSKDKVWYFGGYWDRSKGDLKHATGTLTDVGDSVHFPDWLTGMGTLVPIDVFKKVGHYDAKNFPHYFGDADLSLRAKAGGYNLAVSPRAFVFADLSSNWLDKWLKKPSLSFFWNLFNSRRSQYNIKKRYLFYKKYWGKNYIQALLRLYLVGLIPLYRLWAVFFIKRLVGKI